jgi:hypothetical protein
MVGLSISPFLNRKREDRERPFVVHLEIRRDCDGLAEKLE